jgi:DNA-binding MarR family transcriptional regulator
LSNKDASCCALRTAQRSFASAIPLAQQLSHQVEPYIALRYNRSMVKEITSAEYQALAELRYRIRKFVREGDAVARAAGLEPQQYLLLLALRGLPEGVEATISTLADRLALKHHSTVELIDRLEMHGYVRRSRSRDDRRRVLVTLLPRGEKLLEQVARDRIGELRSSGAALARAISALLENGQSSQPRKHAMDSSKRK